MKPKAVLDSFESRARGEAVKAGILKILGDGRIRRNAGDTARILSNYEPPSRAVSFLEQVVLRQARAAIL